MLIPIKSFVPLLIFLAGLGVGFLGQWFQLAIVARNINRCIETHPSEYRCIRQALKNVKLQTLHIVMQIAEQATQDEGDSTGLFSCHHIGHIAGDIVSQSSDTTASLIASCGSGCGYGCIHGVIAGRIRRDATLLDNFDQVCVSSVEHRMELICYHGLGHALAELSGYDIGQALLGCNAMGNSDLQEQCAGGVFMEILQPPLQNHAPSQFSCSDIPTNYKNLCLIDGALGQYEKTKDVKRSMETCRSFGLDISNKCAQVLGGAVFEREYGDSRSIVSTCEQTEEFFMDCIKGAIQSSFMNDETTRVGERICRFLSADIVGKCQRLLEEERREFFSRV